MSVSLSHFWAQNVLMPSSPKCVPGGENALISNCILLISSTTWNHKFELTDGLYSASDIQDYFELIIEKHENVTGNPSIMINVDKIKNGTTFKTKTGYYLARLTP